MDQEFNYFYCDAGFGPAFKKQDVSKSSIEKNRGKLPDQLLQYWNEYGWCGYGNGLIWIVDPDEYAPVVDAWLEGTPFEGRDSYHTIAVSAFGELFLWGETTGLAISISSLWGMIFPGDESAGVAEGKGDLMIRGFFVGLDKDMLDESDDAERPLFDRAVKKLGVLNAGQMYGLVPALALGGSCDLKHLEKVDAVTHLIMLAQLGERQIMQDVVADAKAAGLLDGR